MVDRLSCNHDLGFLAAVVSKKNIFHYKVVMSSEEINAVVLANIALCISENDVGQSVSQTVSQLIILVNRVILNHYMTSTRWKDKGLI